MSKVMKRVMSMYPIAQTHLLSVHTSPSGVQSLLSVQVSPGSPEIKMLLFMQKFKTCLRLDICNYYINYK